jgi:UDP-glucose 4-epimerase
MKRVLITGGAGFIGSNLTDAYLAKGAEVVAIDDLSTGKEENLEAAFKNPRFRLVVGDIRDDAVVSDLVRDCDEVIHLAARIGLQLVIESPLKTLEANVDGTQAILRHASKHGRKILITSTSEVYGLSTSIPSREDGPIAFGAPTTGRWSYACSKAYDEFLALAHHRENGLQTVIVRLFNTVGPRQTGRYGMVVPRFVRQALNDEPLTVYGDGSQTRCFCHVDDVTGALMRLAQDPKAVGEVFNIGNPQEVHVVDLAKRVIELTNSSSAITFVPFDRAYGAGFEEIMRRVPDITKARTRIGFAPSRSLDDVLRDVIAERTASEALAA